MARAQTKTFTLTGLEEAVKDSKVWLFMITYVYYEGGRKEGKGAKAGVRLSVGGVRRRLGKSCAWMKCNE